MSFLTNNPLNLYFFLFFLIFSFNYVNVCACEYVHVSVRTVEARGFGFRGA